MRKWFCFALVFCFVSLAQADTPIISIWTSNGKCDLGCCRLEIREEGKFVMAWIINTIDYGTYILKDDILELKVTNSRDYYEGDGKMESANKKWRFFVKNDQLVPFYFEVVSNGNVSVLINQIDETCAISFSKQNKLKRF